MSPLSFWTRLWLCWVAWFKVLFDGELAARVLPLLQGKPALPEPEPKLEEPRAEPRAEPAQPSAQNGTDLAPALQLLGLFQREGRLIDFLQQEIAGFSDADVGAAARVVHEGCRKALLSHASIRPVRTEAEGARLRIDDGLNPEEIKLTGNVGGKPPYQGVLRHRGWRVEELKLPTLIQGHNARVLAPAEVEI